MSVQQDRSKKYLPRQLYQITLESAVLFVQRLEEKLFLHKHNFYNVIPYRWGTRFYLPINLIELDERSKNIQLIPYKSSTVILILVD